MPRDELDLDKYSMLVAAGGDGTYHEVINGMLARKDGKKIPIGMIPNGSGNDTLRSLGADQLDQALDYICSRQVIKIDTTRAMLDFAPGEETDATAEKLKQEDPAQYFRRVRHIIINGAVSLAANVTKEAQKYKQCCGMQCYTVATLELVFTGRNVQDLWEIELDG